MSTSGNSSGFGLTGSTGSSTPPTSSTADSSSTATSSSAPASSSNTSSSSKSSACYYIYPNATGDHVMQESSDPSYYYETEDGYYRWHYYDGSWYISDDENNPLYSYEGEPDSPVPNDPGELQHGGPYLFCPSDSSSSGSGSGESILRSSSSSSPLSSSSSSSGCRCDCIQIRFTPLGGASESCIQILPDENCGFGSEDIVLTFSGGSWSMTIGGDSATPPAGGATGDCPFGEWTDPTLGAVIIEPCGSCPSTSSGSSDSSSGSSSSGTSSSGTSSSKDYSAGSPPTPPE